VRVRSRREILEMLDVNNKSRGLFFDREMMRYCGRTARLCGRVERIIDERSGKMIHLTSGCIVLDDVGLPGSVPALLPSACLHVLAGDLARACWGPHYGSGRRCGVRAHELPPERIETDRG
jgi:hypothetical protein